MSMPRSNRISSTCRSDSDEADHLGRAVEITEGIAHRRRLRILARRLKPIYSDIAVCLNDEENSQIAGSNVVWDARDHGNAESTAQPPVASGEPRSLLPSTPFQSSSGECRLRGGYFMAKISGVCVGELSLI